MTYLQLIFVYGTLKRGERYHYLLQGCRGQPALAYKMHVHAGPGYPYAVRGRGQVRGEVYQVSPAVMQRLDRLEEEYRRELTAVRLANGQRLEAWIYLTELAYRYPRLTSGIWHGTTVTR